MMGYSLAPETVQVIGAAAMAIGIVLGIIVVAVGLAQLGHIFLSTHMD